MLLNAVLARRQRSTDQHGTEGADGQTDQRQAHHQRLHEQGRARAPVSRPPPPAAIRVAIDRTGALRDCHIQTEETADEGAGVLLQGIIIKARHIFKPCIRLPSQARLAGMSGAYDGSVFTVNKGAPFKVAPPFPQGVNHS